MKNNMKNKTGFITAVFFCLFMLMTSPASALTIVDSSNFEVDLDSGVPGAYITDSAAPSNQFNQELFTSGNEIKSGTILFSEIPYFSFENTRYFQFVYDMQETGGAGVGGRQVNIDDIVVSATGGTLASSTVLWNFDQTTNGSIILNSASPFTTTPLGAGGDMELYVPVSLFVGYGLTGSDSLTLTVTQSLSDNGTDEWVVLGSGNFFGSDEPISNVPIPPAVWLFGSGLLGLGLLGGRRKKS